MSPQPLTISRLQRLRFRLALWWAARTLPLRIAGKDFAALLPAMSQHAPYGGLPAAYILKRVKRTVRRPLLMRDRRCLREGLLAIDFLIAAGYQPELHFGVERHSVNAARLAAHCWVVLDGNTVLNPPSHGMVPIFAHRPAAPRNHVPAGIATAAFD
jgi:hypothetical protein